MTAVIHMAIKDLRILFRDRAGAFFIVGFPVLMGVFFGLILGNEPGSEGTAAIRIAIVDLDQSEFSGRFIDALSGNRQLDIEISGPAAVTPSAAATEGHSDPVAVARDSVRRGQRIGMIVLPAGFGTRAGLFWGTPPVLQVGIDPSRRGEAGVIHGFVMEAMGTLAGERFRNPLQLKLTIDAARNELSTASDLNPSQRQLLLSFFSAAGQMLEMTAAIQSADNGLPGTAGFSELQFAKIEPLDIAVVPDPGSRAEQLQKLNSRWDISFPQAMMWGVMACVAGFSISIARERTRGTMFRLQVSPVTRLQILSGKALGCFVTVVGVIVMLTVLGYSLGMRPVSYSMLIVAVICVAVCFVGIMMAMSVLGRTEQAVSGSGWAINLVMAMFGGCMVPVMFMPESMQQASVLSPIRWAILALEGAIWRGFSASEMLIPCAILTSVGIAGLLTGTVILSRQQA